MGDRRCRQGTNVLPPERVSYSAMAPNKAVQTRRPTRKHKQTATASREWRWTESGPAQVQTVWPGSRLLGVERQRLWRIVAKAAILCGAGLDVGLDVNRRP